MSIVFFFIIIPLSKDIILCTSKCGRVWIWARIPHITVAFLTRVTHMWFVQRPKTLSTPCVKGEKRKEKWPLFRAEFAEGEPFALCEWFKSQWIWFIVFSQTSIICKNSTWFCNKGPMSSSIESCCSVAVITGAFSVSLWVPSLPLSASVKVQLSSDAELMLIHAVQQKQDT